jgi:3-phosphoshikimate 1-carboxyvinyltransferase
VAALAPGTSTLAGAPHLRVKESDRIAAMRTNLASFGVACEERVDGLRIHGGKPLRAAAIDSFGDHRIAQAGLLLALAADGASRLDDEAVLAVSYPNLLDALRSTGGRVEP